MQSIVDQIEKAQHPEGYLNIYFTVVDPEGRFMNVRDLHELCESPHAQPQSRWTDLSR